MTIYLDNSATTKVRDEVREAMMPYIEEKWGNPSSIHKLGRHAHSAMDKSREQVAALLNCSPEEIYFTPCATYSNNLAILGRAQSLAKEKSGWHLITTAIEHPSCAGPAKYLEGQGWSVTFLPVSREGIIDLEDLKRAIKPNTAMISIMWANNEIGSLQPIEEIAQLAGEREIFFHTDAVQVPGKLPIDVKKVPVDSLSLSGHKFYAPKGIGILYLKKGTEVKPIIFGGGQESAFFPGTEGLPNIVAIGKAAQLALAELEDVPPKLKAMQSVLINELAKLDGIKFTGPAKLEKRLPGHVSFVVPGIEGEAAVMQADLKGLFISSASACKKGILQPSHVVTALGLSDEDAMGSLRISAGRFNTEEECRKAAEILLTIIPRVREHAAHAKTSN